MHLAILGRWYRLTFRFSFRQVANHPHQACFERRPSAPADVQFGASRLTNRALRPTCGAPASPSTDVHSCSIRGAALLNVDRVVRAPPSPGPPAGQRPPREISIC